MYVNILCMRQPLYVETWDKISKVHDCVDRAIGGLNFFVVAWILHACKRYMGAVLAPVTHGPLLGGCV